MRRWAITVLVAGLVGGTALALSGCGSTSGTTAPAPNPNVVEPPASVWKRSSDRTLLTSSNCDGLYEIANAVSEALGGSNGRLDRTAVMLAEFAARGPSDIRSQFVVLAAAYSKFVVALKDMPRSLSTSPGPHAMATFKRLENEIDMIKFSIASTNVAEWAAKNCDNFKRETTGPSNTPQDG